MVIAFHLLNSGLDSRDLILKQKNKEFVLQNRFNLIPIQELLFEDEDEAISMFEDLVRAYESQ